MKVTEAFDSNKVNTVQQQAQDILGKDEFLKLLVTELRYQDPLDPISNRDMIAQLAQFSALEQMANVARSTEGVQSFALLGKQVTATKVYQNGQAIESQITGEVLAVRKNAGSYYLEVDIGLVDAQSGAVRPVTVSLEDVVLVENYHNS